MDAPEMLAPSLVDAREAARAFLASLERAQVAPVAPALPSPARPETPTERLWSCHPETRLNVRELALALDRSVSWVHKHTSAAHTGAGARYRPIPHRMLEGRLVFVVSELRAWVKATEVVVVPGKHA